jgi:electron transfer flavoprotein alpha subunit
VGVDKGLVPFERQIGITGKTVSPRFLIACGISGANEFIRGIEKAELKAGINIDPKAPVFEKTDLCLLGDVGEIIAAAIKGLKRRNEKLNG